MWYFQRLKQVLAQLDEEIGEQHQEIAELNKQIEWIISTFTVDQVIHNPNIKALVLQTESVYLKHNEKIFPHLAILIAAAKK